MPSRSGFADRPAAVSGSIRERVPSAALVTQTAPRADGEPQRRAGRPRSARRRRRRRRRAGAQRQRRPRRRRQPPPAPSHCFVRRAQPAAGGAAARRPMRHRSAARRGVGEHPGRRRRRALALAGGLDQRRRRSRSARPGPWRRRARSPRRAPAASPARCRPPCARRGRSRSAPRRGRSRASRRRRPGRPRSPRHCSGDMYSTVPTIEAPLPDAAVAERLGEAEVGEVGAVAFEQDVVRLDVAVDDAGGVGGVERFGDLAEQRRPPRPGGSGPSRSISLRRSPPSTSRIATISSPSSSRAS